METKFIEKRSKNTSQYLITNKTSTKVKIEPYYHHQLWAMEKMEIKVFFLGGYDGDFTFLIEKGDFLPKSHTGQFNAIVIASDM